MLKENLVFFFFVFLISCSTDKSVEVILTGDVLLDRGVRKTIENHNVKYVFRGVETEFKKVDFVLINLEGPLTDTISPVNKKYIFRFDAKCAEDLKEVGVTHCLLANNHTVDQGLTGLRNTIENLKKVDLKFLGIGYDKKERLTPMILEKNDIKIAVFNSCLLKIENWISHTNGLNINTEDFSDLEIAVREFKKKNPKVYVLCVLHWGYEFKKQPELFQRLQAKRLIEAGSDVIIGHHPHVVQINELINNKLVVYSLGNFVFDQKNPEGKKALLAKLFFSKTEIKYELIDVAIDNNCPKLK